MHFVPVIHVGDYLCWFDCVELKEVTEKVKDYCNLMKDFPLNDLLAASSLEGIKSAIAAIFMHMKKMRNTEYPPARAVNLLEAISKDVLSQMTKVRTTYLIFESYCLHHCIFFINLLGSGYSQVALSHL